MFWTIAKKEIRENLYSYKFIIISILLMVLILTSMFVMYRDYQLRLENYSILKPDSNKPVAIIPPTPLSIFAKGLDGTMGRSFLIEFGGRIEVGGNQQSANDLFRLFTTPDLLYIVKVIMALCALLLAFNMVSGEKETKTLGLSLSNSVKRPTFILGKWIGGFLSLITPFFVALLSGIIIVTLSPIVHLTSGEWMKLGVFIIVSIMYIAFFFSLGVFISCLTHQSASSLVISLFFWALIVYVIPNMGNTLARQFVDIPSVHQLEMKLEHIWIKEVFEANQTRKQKGEFPMEQMTKSINAENDKIMSDYRTSFYSLVNLSKNITRFSPAAAYTYLATDILGTGISEEQKLKQAVLVYKDMIWDKPIDSGGNLLGDFPVFSFTRSSIRNIMIIEGLMNISILILFTVLAFVTAYVSFLRYDVR